QNLRVTILVVGRRHRPPVHFEKLFALGGGDGDIDRRRGPVKEFRNISLGQRGSRLAGRGHRHGQPRRTIHVAVPVLLMGPALGRRIGDEPVPGRLEGSFALQTQRDRNDVGGVRLQHHGAAITSEDQRRGLRIGGGDGIHQPRQRRQRSGGGKKEAEGAKKRRGGGNVALYKKNPPLGFFMRKNRGGGCPRWGGRRRSSLRATQST